jgi:hypothetical protein
VEAGALYYRGGEEMSDYDVTEDLATLNEVAARVEDHYFHPGGDPDSRRIAHGIVGNIKTLSEWEWRAARLRKKELLAE